MGICVHTVLVTYQVWPAAQLAVLEDQNAIGA